MIREIAHGSEEYRHAVALRYAILRAPLGLSFTDDELAAESDSIHLGTFDGFELVACLVLKPIDAEHVQMRQVAVAVAHQRRGLGTELSRFAERRAAELGYRVMVVHAREHATDFYQRMGYELIGEPFYEVTLRHFSMQKEINLAVQ